MSLNIENPEAHELAKELAELTGESSYALASVSGQALLYKGDDFRYTDIRSALQS